MGIWIYMTTEGERFHEIMRYGERFTTISLMHSDVL